MNDRNRVSLDLNGAELADAPGALRRAALLSSGSDAALMRLIADQLDEANGEIDLGDADGVECVFTPRDQALS